MAAKTDKKDPKAMNEQELLVAIYRAVASIQTVVLLSFLAGIVAAVILIGNSN